MRKKISRHSIKLMSPTVKALKAARILRGLSRKEAAMRCGWTPKVFEQIENGRSYVSRERVNKILKAIGYGQEDFKALESNPEHALALARDSNKFVATLKTKPRRNFYKRITKESRVLRILRKKTSFSQYQASELCGYANSIFGQIENGRIELPMDRIQHIVHCLGFTMLDFKELMKSEVLRDELISECSYLLEKLDDQKLSSARLVIMSLGGL
ncbi:helix-turn-helix transcriptional regulator [bacterium]|nr:helix-turn-helix transcriptional regulator [bacterium]